MSDFLGVSGEFGYLIVCPKVFAIGQFFASCLVIVQ